MKYLKALIVEDSEDDALILLRHLKLEGYIVDYLRVDTPAEMEDAIAGDDWQIVLSDYSMPRFDGLMALAILKKTGKDVPFIVISGTIGEDVAVQAMLAGVDDYFVKGNLRRLVPAIERELKESENREARRQAERDLGQNKIRLQLALRAAGMGVWEWNIKTGVVYWSPECHAVLGNPPFDGTFDSFLGLVHPDDTAALQMALDETIQTKGHFNAEFRCLRADGDIVWCSNSGMIEFDGNGDPRVMIGTVQDITARKNYETSISESEENLRAIIQASTQHVWTADKDGSGRDLFAWFTKVSGRKIESIDDLIEIIHPDDRQPALDGWRQALEERNNFSQNIRFLTAAGSYCFMATRSVPIFNADGTFRQWIGTCNDITQRMRAEEALRKNERELKIVSDTVPTKIWKMDRDLNILFLNKGAAEWFDGDEQGLIGRNLRDVYCGGSVEGLMPEIERVLAGEKFMLERPSFRRDGEDFVRIHYVPEMNENNEVVSFFNFIVDLTEIKQNEENLRKSERRFRSLVNATAQIVWTADAEGVVNSALTPEGAALAGTGTDLMVEWIARIHPDDRDDIVSGFKKAVKTSNRYRSEYRMLISDGTYHHYVARGVAVYEKDGTIREWVGTLTDITKSRNAEEELRRSEDQLRQAQKLESVGRLAGGIAHDFNNMLTAINGYSDLTLRRLPESDPLRRNIEEIKKAGERSAALTQQLLAFSRRTILQMKVLDINQVVNDSIVMFQRLIGEDIEVVAELSPEVNSLNADSGQLAQMILNLVVNARDAMPKGGTITIKTDNILLDSAFASRHAGASAGNYVLLSVRDTGVGIDEEIKQQIFEPFFTTKEMGKGTGLGLSTVYGIVNQLGGHLEVTSKLNVGSTFDVYLPAVQPASETAEPGRVAREFRKGNETILLVEDEELVRNLSRQVLESCGYEVLEARDGFLAWELCKLNGKKIDLLLTDVVMPRMSGRELAEKVKAIHPDIRILFTSGYTEDRVVRHGVRESEMNFIQKPFSFEDLASKVRELLDGPSR